MDIEKLEKEFLTESQREELSEAEKYFLIVRLLRNREKGND